MNDRDPYPFHRGYQEVLGQRDGQRALRREIATDVPARPGLWDYAMIVAGSAACFLYKHSEAAAAVVGFFGGLLIR